MAFEAFMNSSEGAPRIEKSYLTNQRGIDAHQRAPRSALAVIKTRMSGEETWRWL